MFNPIYSTHGRIPHPVVNKNPVINIYETHWLQQSLYTPPIFRIRPLVLKQTKVKCEKLYVWHRNLYKSILFSMIICHIVHLISTLTRQIQHSPLFMYSNCRLWIIIVKITYLNLFYSECLILSLIDNWYYSNFTMTVRFE